MRRHQWKSRADRQTTPALQRLTDRESTQNADQAHPHNSSADPGSAHGAPRLIGDGLATARKAGVTGQVTVRADSAYYQYPVVAAAYKGGARFSITARMDPGVVAAISRIPESAWVGIKYPKAI